MIIKESVEDFPMAEPNLILTSSSTVTSPFTNYFDTKLHEVLCSTNPLSIYHNDFSDNVIFMDFEINNFMKEATDVMYELFKTQKLTDVTLCVNSEFISCHRIVLAGASPYFCAMFTGAMRESDQSEIKLHGLSSMALRKLIDFAYTGKIQISERNVCELLMSASMLQINHVVQVCCTFLEKQLYPFNAIGIQNFAVTNNCVDLINSSQKFIDQNFNEVVKHDEFLNLNSNQLLNLIKREELNVRTEAEVYNAVIRWANYKRTSRMSILLEALSVVRCHILSPIFIQSQIKNCNLLADVNSAKMHLESVLQDLVEHRHITVSRRSAGTADVSVYYGKLMVKK